VPGSLLLPLPLEDFQGPRGLDSLAAWEKASAVAGSPSTSSPDLPYQPRIYSRNRPCISGTGGNAMKKECLD
jgi:hypothetical protein